MANKVSMEIITERCINCNLCIKACPAKVFKNDDHFILIDNQNRKYCLNCNDCVSVCPRDAIFKDDVTDIGLEGNVLGRDFSCNPEQLMNLLLNIRPVRNFTSQTLEQQEKEYLVRLASLAPRNGFDEEVRNTGVILVENRELLAAIEQYTYHYLLALKKSLASVWQTIPNLFNAALRQNINATLSRVNLILEAYSNQVNMLTFDAPNLLILHSAKGSRDAGENLTMMGYQLALGAEVLDLGMSFLSWVSSSLQPVMMKKTTELEALHQRLAIPKNREIRSVFAIGKKQVSYRKLNERKKDSIPLTVF